MARRYGVEWIKTDSGYVIDGSSTLTRSSDGHLTLILSEEHAMDSSRQRILSAVARQYKSWQLRHGDPQDDGRTFSFEAPKRRSRPLPISEPLDD